MSKLGGGGGKNDYDFLTIRPTSGCHGQKLLTKTMAKISKLPWSNGQNWFFLTMTIDKIYELPWSNGQNLSILTIDHGQIPGCHGHGQCLTPHLPKLGSE